jgi:hypothetical protein
MQRTMTSILKSMLQFVHVRFAIYLDDILLIGSALNIRTAVGLIRDSTLLINEEKSIFIPTRRLEYLGVLIDLDSETMALTKKFSLKLQRELLLVRHKRLSLRYKQRLGGLINFARPILKLPLQTVHLAFYWPDRLYNFILYFHTRPTKAVKYITQKTIYVDATPTQIALTDIDACKAQILLVTNPILENEFLAIWLAHKIRPRALIMSDNQAAIYLFRRGKLPPSWRKSYNYTKLLIETYNVPILAYVPTAANPADRFSRVGVG